MVFFFFFFLRLVLHSRTSMATKQDITRLPPDVNKIIFVKCVSLSKDWFEWHSLWLLFRSWGRSF